MALMSEKFSTNGRDEPVLHGRLKRTISQGSVRSIGGNTPPPSDFYFGDIDCVFSPFKDAEIDLTVLRVESEVAQEDFDKKQKERGQQKPVTSQSLAYQSPLVRRDNDDDDAW